MSKLGITNILFAIILIGCSSSPLSEEEQLWRRSIDAENWQTCQLVYSKFGGVIYSDHVHQKHRSDRPIEIKMHLGQNHCKNVLGEYWISY